jgi:hypothetical protein
MICSCGLPARTRIRLLAQSSRNCRANFSRRFSRFARNSFSPEAARLQIISRVAVSRDMTGDKVKELVERFVEPPQWGFLG